MANTYHQIHLQVVFAVKFRNAVLDKAWRKEFFGIIGNLINETGCKTYNVNGVEDHVHLFFGLKPSISVSKVMESVKSLSSKWLNEQGLLDRRFEWQKGYGVFSYHQSMKDRVYNYVANQEKHHEKKPFLAEYKAFLDAFEIDYDDAYIFDELI